ncbi:MAG: ketoacyl-ACP synthase III [Acidobacteria bacterium]|nr:ketoacyl-ACP synthase III [Acidobacteriota bacterium]MBP7475507.1 ketoacyl-ACP synthase III [Pyrinomonadaceae bacterium]MBP9108413.1 ketoacyl-ACP synthase III [Pyrinomonadaceae bacterium]
MRDARIIGTGIYVPEKVLTNADLSANLGVDIDEFVTNIVGISERHVAADDESTADLATNAAIAALEDAGLDAADLDLILLATDTPEYVSPATSVVVQHRIGAVNAGTFDINSACAGFVTTLDTAFKYIISDASYKNVLVIGCYAMSKFIDWKDKKTSTLFADGAGAMVLKAVDGESHFMASKLVADGSYHNFMGIFAGGTKEPITEGVLAENNFNKLRFAKKYPPEVNINGWPKIVDDVLAKANITREDVDVFLWTQVNLSTIKLVMEEMQIPYEKTHTIMDKWGYTGSACIPMVFHDALAAGKIRRGDTIVFCASGGGLNMACLAMKY